MISTNAQNPNYRGIFIEKLDLNMCIMLSYNLH